MTAARFMLTGTIAFGAAFSAYGLADERQRARWQHRGVKMDDLILRALARRGITMLSNKST